MQTLSPQEQARSILQQQWIQTMRENGVDPFSSVGDVVVYPSSDLTFEA